MLAAALATAALPSAAPGQDPCAATRAADTRPVAGAPDPAGDLRVYAIQYKQEVRHVETYESFALKMDCLVRDLVLPTADGPDADERADRPTLVAFNEDIGLATLATGSRGAAARAIAEHGPKDPRTLPGAIAAFAAVGAAYHRPIAYYAAREPATSPQRLILAGATDTFALGFMRTFSEMARRYGIFVVASNNQAEFRATLDPVAFAALRDPDDASDAITPVYEALDVDAIPESVGTGRAGIDVHNRAWMWSPDPGTTAYAATRYAGLGAGPGGTLTPEDPRANVIHENKKTPLTAIETGLLDLSDDRDLSPANTGPFAIPGVAGARIGYAISLPAFKWGSALGKPFSGDPCASPLTWMRCLDARGVNVLLQPEANGGGPWADYVDGAGWSPVAFQSLSWNDSAWRAVADPTAGFRYAVTPFMVGNLVDVTFDGQSAIFERCLPRPSGGDTCAGNLARNHAGAAQYVPCHGATERCDDPALEPYSGLKREFVALAGWVLAECPLCLSPIADRERLAARSRAMEAGTGSPDENRYVETAVWADLDLDPPA